MKKLFHFSFFIGHLAWAQSAIEQVSNAPFLSELFRADADFFERF
jgi:hypothetical protein